MNEFGWRVAALFFQRVVILAGLQFVVGTGRLLSLAQYAVAGVGAYAAAQVGNSALLALIVGCVSGGIASWCLGFLCARLDEHYIAFATLAGSEALSNIFR